VEETTQQIVTDEEVSSTGNSNLEMDCTQFQESLFATDCSTQSKERSPEGELQQLAEG
jgi:hypothetical protein